MEWEITSVFNYDIDGYDGYKIVSYLDGYCGIEGYEFEYIILKNEEVPHVKKMKTILLEKIENYRKIENPNNKISNRLSRMEGLLETYSGILSIIEEED